MDDNLGLKEEELFNLIKGWVMNGYPGRVSMLNHVRYKYADFKNFMEDVNPRNPNEMVLAIGGYCNGELCQHIEIGANYGVLTWKEIKAIYNMPVKKASFGIGLVNNIMFIFGGWSPESPEGCRRSTFAFDTVKKVSR